jgi:hypothetical protein
MDFGRKAQFFTLNVISSIAFGSPFGYLTVDKDINDFIEKSDESMEAIGMVTVLPWINWVLQTRLVKRYLPSGKDPIGFGKVVA